MYLVSSQTYSYLAVLLNGVSDEWRMYIKFRWLSTDHQPIDKAELIDHTVEIEGWQPDAEELEFITPVYEVAHVRETVFPSMPVSKTRTQRAMDRIKSTMLRKSAAVKPSYPSRDIRVVFRQNSLRSWMSCEADQGISPDTLEQQLSSDEVYQRALGRSAVGTVADSAIAVDSHSGSIQIIDNRSPPPPRATAFSQLSVLSFETAGERRSSSIDLSSSLSSLSLDEPNTDVHRGFYNFPSATIHRSPAPAPIDPTDPYVKMRSNLAARRGLCISDMPSLVRSRSSFAPSPSPITPITPDYTRAGLVDLSGAGKSEKSLASEVRQILESRMSKLRGVESFVGIESESIAMRDQ